MTKSQAQSSELTRAGLWAAVEMFVSRQNELVAPDEDLKVLIPRGAPRSLLEAMAAFAYFKRGDAFRGRYMPSCQRIGTATLVAENEIVMMKTVQQLLRMPILTLQREDEPLYPRGRDPRAWARKITMSILMGNFAQLVKTDNEEREAQREVNRKKNGRRDSARSKVASGKGTK